MFQHTVDGGSSSLLMLNQMASATVHSPTTGFALPYLPGIQLTPEESLLAANLYLVQSSVNQLGQAKQQLIQQHQQQLQQQQLLKNAHFLKNAPKNPISLHPKYAPQFHSSFAPPVSTSTPQMSMMPNLGTSPLSFAGVNGSGSLLGTGAIGIGSFEKLSSANSLPSSPASMSPRSDGTSPSPQPHQQIGIHQVQNQSINQSCRVSCRVGVLPAAASNASLLGLHNRHHNQNNHKNVGYNLQKGNLSKSGFVPINCAKITHEKIGMKNHVTAENASSTSSSSGSSSSSSSGGGGKSRANRKRTSGELSQMLSTSSSTNSTSSKRTRLPDYNGNFGNLAQISSVRLKNNAASLAGLISNTSYHHISPNPQTNLPMNIQISSPISHTGLSINPAIIVESTTNRKDAKRTFLDLYEVYGVIGVGGGGMVYAGRRITDKLPVAIKRVMREKVKRWEKVQGHNVPQEIALMLRVYGHNGIIKLVDWYECLDSFILIMERPENSVDLFDYIRECGKMHEDDARIIFKQVVEAVHHIHKCGVVHRDIKDENVILNRESGEAKLIDFGCGTLLKDQAYRDFSGTPEFYPPEWFTHRVYHARSAATWSLGILLYDMVCGEIPFKNKDKILENKVIFKSGITEDVKSLIRWMIAHDPDSRPSLEDILNHRWTLNQH